MQKFLGFALALLLLVMATSCSPPSERISSPEPTATVTTAAPTPVISPAASSASAPSEELVRSAQRSLGEAMNVSPEAITLQQAEAVEWSDACLGAAQPDELCAQMMTPGYRLTFATPKGEYTVHSDRTGRSVRVVQ